MNSDQKPNFWKHFFDVLKIPCVDKIIAVAAVLPHIFLLYLLMKGGGLNIPFVAVTINFLLLIITMILRTPPVRITTNPWYWLLTFTATYGGMYAPLFSGKGISLVPSAVTNTLSLFSLGINVWARLSLGRNIGFVPAQRAIVTDGVYRFVRHPIYTALFISYFSFVLRQYSLRCVILFLIVCSLFVLKSIIEEIFLREDPEYAAYLTRVRWRWFPGLA
jgi:protein-S-isoprenylcysteine O-methyltransferase Ste14